MIPGPLNLELYQGDDWLLPLRLRHYVDGVAGDPIVLTGMTGKAQIRVREAAPEVLAEITVTVNPDQVVHKGELTLALTHTQTGALPPNDAVWDLQFTDSDGKILTYLKGKVTVDAEVTRV